MCQLGMNKKAYTSKLCITVTWIYTADEDETNSLPEPLTGLYDPLTINWSEEDIKATSKKIYERYIRSYCPYQFENL